METLVLQPPPPGPEFGAVRAFARLVSAGTAAFAVATTSAAVHRWYVREPIPEGLAVLFGVSVIGLYLNTVGLFGGILAGTEREFLEASGAAFNVAVLLSAGLVTPFGRRTGDRLATNVFAVSGAREVDAEVSRLVRSVGRVTAVELPEEIDDVEGYDPVDGSVKERLAGKTLLFPRRLTIAELRERLEVRLEHDYGVGHVDVELDTDGRVTYLALGLRAAGIGPTLAPGTAAVAVHADPPSGASPGDVVQVWETTAEPSRSVTGELRAVADDVVTVAVDEDDAAELVAGEEYRLVTLPAEPRADREFVSLLHAAEETVGVISVAEESRLGGRTVGDLGVTVAALRPADGSATAVPSRSRTLRAGDEVYVVGLPESVRRLEAESAPVEAQPS